MKISEILNENILTEGGDATSKRFFSELGALAAWAGKGNNPTFDPEHPEQWLDTSKLESPEILFKDIKRFLTSAKSKYDSLDKKPHMDLDDYYELSKRGRDLILADMASRGLKPPQKFGWVGGINASSVGATPSDVNFIGNAIAGVSIKDDGGVGLANLGAGELEFEGVGDLFGRLAPNELYSLKSAVMTDLLAELKISKTMAAGSQRNYIMTWIEEEQKVLIQAPDKKNIKGNEEQLTNWGFLQKSNDYQRVLGSYFLKNGARYKNQTDALLMATSEKIKEAIEKKVVPYADKLAKLGGFGDRAYYYQLAVPFKVAYVPDKDTANDIEVIKITPPLAMSGGIKYLIALRRRGIEGFATVEAHIRYAQGIFASSPSFRIQSLKGHENLYWEVLTPTKSKAKKG